MHSISVITGALPFILGGTLVTMAIVAASLLLGFCLGLPFAIVQVYGSPLARRCISLYVWFFRGIPVLVLLFLFYGIFISFGSFASPFLITCAAMGCTSAAYQSQIFRGSIEALPAGQMKAARSLGMSDAKGIVNIIVPQALRLSIPGWANEFSILLKDSAICYVLGTQEIMARAGAIAARTHEHLALYATAGVIYFVLTVVVLKLLRMVEEKYQIPGYSVGGISLNEHGGVPA